MAAAPPDDGLEPSTDPGRLRHTRGFGRERRRGRAWRWTAKVGPRPRSRASRPQPRSAWTASSTSRPGSRPPGSPASGSINRWTAAPAEEATEARVFYSPNAICFGIVAHEKARRDSCHGRRPRQHRQRGIASTSIRSTIVAEPTSFGSTHSARRATAYAPRARRVRASSPAATTSTRISPSSQGPAHRQGYMVEIRIPFKSLRYPGRSADVGLQVTCVVQRPGTKTRGPTRAGRAPVSRQGGREGGRQTSSGDDDARPSRS